MPKKNQKPELIIHKTVVKYLRELQLNQDIVVFFANINENSRGDGNAPHMGLLKGVSDLTVMYNDKVLWLELKRDKKVLKSGKLSSVNLQSLDQQYFERKIEKVENNYYHCCYGYDEASECINSDL